MTTRPKVVIVSQHYPPDPSTTAAIMGEIARHLAVGHRVLVLSGTPGSAMSGTTASERPILIEIRSRVAAKAALVRRAIAELAFTMRAVAKVLETTQSGDVVLTVTAPFILPYAVVLAAWLKGAKSALIMHDLFPDVLVTAGLLGKSSPVTWKHPSRQRADVLHT